MNLEEIFKLFNEWERSLGTTRSETIEDGGIRWDCFLAGYKAKADQDDQTS